MAKDIAVTLTSDTRKFQQGMKSARDDLNLFSNTIKTVRNAVVGFLSFQTVKAGLNSLTDTIGKLDDLAAQADRLGVSTEFLSELQHVAKLSDTDIEALNGGLEKLEKNLGKATLEGGDLNKMLGRVGLDATELAKLGPEEAFLRIAEATARIKDPIQRAAFVIDVFGKSGQSLLGTLSKGREGIEALRQEARLLGVSLSSDAAEKIGLADDAMKRLDSTMMGLKTSIAVELVPTFTSFVELLSSSVVPSMGTASRELSTFINHIKDLKAMNDAGIIDPFGFEHDRAMDFLRNRMMPKKGGIANPNLIDNNAPPGSVVAGRNQPGNGGDAIDLGGIVKEFKSFAKPLEIDSKEGFSTIARALTKKTADPIANKQLAEAKIANKHLAKIEDGLKNQPKIAPPF